MKVVYGVLLQSDDALQQYLLYRKLYIPTLFGENATEKILSTNTMFISNPHPNLAATLQPDIDEWLDRYSFDPGEDDSEYEP